LNELMIDFAINELGADPLDAIGRFGLTPEELAQARIDRAEFDREQQEFAEFGLDGQDAFLERLVAERTGGFDLGQLSSATNLAPDAVAGAVASPEFSQLLAAAMGGDADPVALVEETAAADPILAAILSEILWTLYPNDF